MQAVITPMMITGKISENAKSAISQHIMIFNKTMQDWQTKMSCGMMNMIQSDKIDRTPVYEELKRVWTQSSEVLNMLHKNTVELQSKFALVETENNQLVFTIKADRFLRNMVRAIVGTLLEVGKGKITVDDFREIIEMKNRGAAGTSAPPQGLFLVDIGYTA